MEFAVVAPVFFLFVLGMIEVGRGLMVTHLLNNAARVGCRVGVLQSSANTDISSAVDGAVQNQGVSGYSVTVKVNNKVADASTAVQGDKITVLLTVPVGNVTWLPGGSYLKGNLSGECSLYRE